MGLAGLHRSFTRKGGVVHCEGVSLETLARRYGTPLFVYSRKAIEDRYREISRAFPTSGCRIFSSAKSNSNISYLRVLRKLGAGVDVVSGGELYRARRAGFRGSDIVFAGVGKTDVELSAAVKLGLEAINVESPSEMGRIAALAARQSKTVRVALRVNPDIDAATHHHLTTGRASTKFGMLLPEALKIAQRFRGAKHLELVGLHFHIGSQITSVQPLRQTAAFARKALLRFHRLGFNLEFVNLGGGIAVSYDGSKVPAPRDYARAMLSELAGLGINVYIEPGRFVAGPSVLLLTRVILHKVNRGHAFLVTDAAMNDLMRPVLYGAYHHVEAVRSTKGARERVSVVGPICEPSDMLARNRMLPKLDSGALLSISTAGAYCTSMGSNYNSRPFPAEVLVSGRSAKIIRRRQTYSHLTSLED